MYARIKGLQLDPDDIIKKHFKKAKIPGISVGLISEAGANVFNYGEVKKGSGIPPTENTLFEIGSMTKTFTAILTAQLQDEGLLSLQDPITKFLPEFANSEFGKNNITLYHLITHTSGIVEIPSKKIPKNLFAFLFRTTKGRLLPPRYSLNTADFLQQVSQLKLKNNPGATFRYSNTGVGLVGKILERVTDSTYEKLVKNRICDVLGMNDTGINVFETHKDKLATGYLYTGKEADPLSIPAIESAGSIRSTVSDMLKFLKANLGLGEFKLSPILEYCKSTKVYPKMGHLNNIILKFSLGVKISRIGLGWIAFERNGAETLWHNGGTDGFTTIMMINLEKNAGVVVLANRALKDHTKLSLELLKRITNG